MTAASMSMMAGPRGTPGALTMAPEVLEQGATPDAKADMFCFGGIVLEALFPSTAEAWKAT
jgi:hypothetical protein